jgi:hypothetical protein
MILPCAATLLADPGYALHRGSVGGLMTMKTGGDEGQVRRYCRMRERIAYGESKVRDWGNWSS